MLDMRSRDEQFRLTLERQGTVTAKECTAESRYVHF